MLATNNPTSALPKGAQTPMSTYELPELLKRWRQEQLTAEQLLGHLLQHLAALEQRVSQLEKEQRNSSKTVN